MSKSLPAVGLLAIAAFVGCAKSAPTPPAEPAAVTTDATDESTVRMSEAEIQTLADEQKVCAVTGEPLGSMGAPVPVRVTDSQGADHTVLLCCESCREELLENPYQHLAKLAQAKEGEAKQE
jgi:hypothetical protein